LFEALSYVNNGRVKRVGSLSYINEGLGYLDNSYTRASGVIFNSAVNAAVAAGADRNTAALANRGLLVKADLPKASPERINSFEVGYKSVLLENTLFVDIDAYTNTYDGFLGQVQVDVPKGATVGSDAAVLAMLDVNRDAGQDRYRVYTNAKNKYRNYGSALGLTYNFYQKYTIAGNVSYNKIKSNTSNDIFVTGFNTPDWATNLTIGNREIVKNLGFSIVYKWQNSFLWESPLVTGTVNDIHTFDAQVTYKLPASNAAIKIGGTNIFNKPFIQYAGGPTIGALVYAAVSFEGLLSK
jgi:iron complex outermembrane receptor protein